MTHSQREYPAHEDLLDLFMEELPAACETIHTAFKAQDAFALKKALHKLQGACAYCGLAHLQAILKDFQCEISKACFSNKRLEKFQRAIDELMRQNLKGSA